MGLLSIHELPWQPLLRHHVGGLNAPRGYARLVLRTKMMEVGLIPRYASTVLSDEISKKRYKNKLQLINGLDPYEIPKRVWKDDVELWPAVTHIHTCMYLIVTPSPYTENKLLNFKSLDCYQKFVKGWVREVFVKSVDDKRIVIGKVSS